MNIQELGFDPYNCSMEELKQKIDFYKNKAALENDFQMAVKLFINSVYGCLGSEYYNLYNPDIAEAVTLQGQDLIKYSTAKIDEYVANIWHTDVEAHIKIAEYMKSFFPEFDMDLFNKLSKQPCNVLTTNQIGGDTDSSYISFNCIIKECQIPEYMGSRFIHAIYKFSLKKYIEKCLDEYAITYNCDKNVEEFELEKVARTVIYLAKKHYVMDIAWADGSGDGKFIEPLKKIICVGIEVVQGSTSPWCRKTQKEFIAWLLDFYNNDKKPEYSEIVNKIKEYRKMFELQDPDSIFKAVNLNNYEKYVLDDKTCIKFSDAPQIPQHASASAKYNYTLYNKAKKYLSKYNIIKKGNRVKVYYVNENESFAYLPYAFPIEFAEPIDFDTNFEKLMLQPLNRLIEAAGFQPVPKGLTYSAPLW